MSRGSHTFRHLDVVRAIKAVRAAGEQVSRIEISRDGKIVVSIGATAPPPGDVDRALERWLNED